MQVHKKREDGWSRSQRFIAAQEQQIHITGIAMSQLYPVCLGYMLILYEAVS